MQPGRAVPLVFLEDHLVRLVLLVVGAASHAEVVGLGSILVGPGGPVAGHIARGTVDPMAAVDTRQKHLVALDPVDGRSNDPNRKDLAHVERSRALEAALEGNPYVEA